MPKVRYTGTAGLRELSAADFKSVGIEDQSKIVAAGVNLRHPERYRNAQRVVEVNEAAAEYLISTGEFESADGGEGGSTEGDQSATTTDTAAAEAEDADASGGANRTSSGTASANADTTKTPTTKRR